MKTQDGATIPQMLENGRKLAEEIRQGKIPGGTEARDWMIIKGVAVYTPYVPLFQTPLYRHSNEARPRQP